MLFAVIFKDVYARCKMEEFCSYLGAGWLLHPLNGIDKCFCLETPDEQDGSIVDYLHELGAFQFYKEIAEVAP